MKEKFHVFLIGLCVGLLCCNQALAKERNYYIQNDTTEILKAGLKTAFSDTPSISIKSLTTSVEYKKNKVKLIPSDSILVILHGIEVKHLPKIDSLNFKVITENQACRLVNKNKSIKVLEVEILQMTEETAKLKIRQSCVDWINKECRFNFMCGSGLGIELSKKNNNWIGEIKSSWAD